MKTDAKPAELKADCSFAWLPLLGLAFLLFNYCVVIYRSRDDPWSIAYILISLIDLVALFYILRVFERTPRDSSLRGKLKAVVWFLTTLLTIMFSYRISAVVSPRIAIMAWSMAVATILGGYYAFFVYKQSGERRIVGTGDERN
jgi:dolichol kinase